MNKDNSFSTKKFIYSIVFNTVVLLATLIVFKPFFEEIDDTQICMIAEGAFGSREWHLIYSNFILGKLYVVLYTFFSSIRWHIVLQYAFVYVGYVMSVYVLSKHKRGTALSLLFVLSTFYEMYVSIQYTKTASFVCVVGFILIFEVVRNMTCLKNKNDSMFMTSNKIYKVENTLLIVFPIILIVYGSLLRKESFFIACVPTAAVGFLELSRTKNIKKYLILLVPVFAVVVLLSYADSYVYSTDDSWSYFMKYNRSRMELNDYRYDILDFTRYREELNKLDVTENDALAILTYQYGDDNVFSYERFKEIRDAFPRKDLNYSVFANLFENLVNETKKSYVLMLGLIGVILALIGTIVSDRSKSSPGFIKDSIRKLVSMIFMGSLCGAAIVYFQYSGRYSHRLFAALVIPTMAVCIYMMDSMYIKDNDSKIIFGGNKNDITLPLSIVLSIIVICLNGLLYMSNNNDFLSNSAEAIPMLREMDQMSKDEESLYIADTFTFQNVHKYVLFDTFKEGELDNFITCGSWYLNSPITKADTKKFGYENPFDALRSSADNVYLLDNANVACKTLFLNEHYDNVYVANEAGHRGGIDIYKVTVLEEVEE